MKNYNDVLRAIENSSQPTITDYISRGFNMTFQEPWLLMGFTFLYFLASTAASAIHDLASSAFNIVVQPGLLAGYVYFYHKLATGKPAEFNDFFSGFKERFGSLILVNFLISLFAIVIIGAIMVPVVLALAGDINFSVDMDPVEFFTGFGGSIFVILLVFFIVMLVALTPFMYVIPILCLTDVSAIDSIKLSWKLALKHYMPTMGLLVLVILISLGGFIALFIGALITIPAVYGAVYAAADDLIGFEEGSQEEDLTDHLLID